MKQLNLVFEDEEHKFLVQERNKTDAKSWRQFILDLVKKGEQNGDKNSTNV